MDEPSECLMPVIGPETADTRKAENRAEDRRGGVGLARKEGVGEDRRVVEEGVGGGEGKEEAAGLNEQTEVSERKGEIRRFWGTKELTR